MKLLLFSDLHTDIATARRLVQISHGMDVVVGAGDFGSARKNVSACIPVLREIECPAVLVPGNNESLEELVAACQPWPQARVLHGTGAEINGVPFFGIGGGVPVTPFGLWSWDFSEEEAAKLLSACPSGAILVSHSPPKGAVDMSGSGDSLGSTAVRDAVVRFKPKLVVCGHIHASGGQQAKVGETTVINAGPHGVVVEL